MAAQTGTMTTEEALADREARFRAFVDGHRARAVSLAWRLVGGDAGAAEDVAQQAFLRAWRALPAFREEAALSTWFYRILVRQAASHRRWRFLAWRGRERLLQLRETRPEAADAPAGDAGLRQRIAAALDRLPRGQREVFALVHLEGFTVVEAAAVLGKAPGTLKSHLHRALVALREDLRDLDPQGGA
jgi:RNA polymerase sigma-70 factor (ECF subfamily)